jgi:HAD superfamily hydrolase (TIGR01509 family)
MLTKPKHPYCIEAVLFDFDGTLTEPGALDFKVIKDEIGCPSHLPVLEFIAKIVDPKERATATTRLEQFEADGAAQSRPNPGSVELINSIRSKGLSIGIITRNSLTAVERALINFEGLTLESFDIIITRDDDIQPKPSGDGIRLAAQRLGIPTERILLVGDFIFDMEAGRRGGSLTALLTNGETPAEIEDQCDFIVTSLDQLEAIITMGLPLSPGKLPNDILETFLERFVFADPSVLISAGIGDDTAAVDIAGKDVLVLKSDPITFATDAIGRYAVAVNANDIATSGALPRWFLTTLLFPSGVSASAIGQVMEDLFHYSRGQGITLCGGHTEITDAVTRPVVTGMMAGTISRKALIDKRRLGTGDRIILTKGVCVEGTAIIAREFGPRLKKMGVSDKEIDTCRSFLDAISILPEARIAANCDGVTAMHDVTEGGIATALEELSIAGGHRLKVLKDRIPIYPETGKICRLLGIDPLGLIGSGSLIICCRPGDHRRLIENLSHKGIQAVCIGEALSAGKGIQARKAGQKTPWPRFAVDEITRLFS